MTTSQSSMEQRHEEWTAEFATRQRWRNALLGIGTFVIVAFVTAAIIAYFSGAAAMPW